MRREYTATFIRSKDVPDLRMPDIGYVGKGHPIHLSAIDFAKGQVCV